MANFKKDYKDTEVRNTHRTKVPRVTLTKVEPADDDKRTRAELLDAIEDLFQNTFFSGRKQSYDKEIDLESLRSILTMLVLSATNSSDDSVGATQEQINAINANTAKTGITTDQTRDIQQNNAKTTFPGFGTTSGKALEGNTTTISTSQANAIVANTAKVSQGLTTANTSMEFDVKGTPRTGYSLNIIVTCNDGIKRSATLTLR